MRNHIQRQKRNEYIKVMEKYKGDDISFFQEQVMLASQPCRVKDSVYSHTHDHPINISVKQWTMCESGLPNKLQKAFRSEPVYIKTKW